MDYYVPVQNASYLAVQYKKKMNTVIIYKYIYIFFFS